MFVSCKEVTFYFYIFEKYKEVSALLKNDNYLMTESRPLYQEKPYLGSSHHQVNAILYLYSVDEH